MTPFQCVKTHTIATPKPQQGEVLIKVASSSVNPCDVDYLELGVGCGGGDGVLGMDMAGTVVACPGCSRLKVGDRVWADIGGGKGEMRGHLGAIPALFGLLTCAGDKLGMRRARDDEGGAFGALGHAALGST